VVISFERSGGTSGSARFLPRDFESSKIYRRRRLIFKALMQALMVGANVE
jgi:hypothetical protein